jgi:hypothetical protein
VIQSSDEGDMGFTTMISRLITKMNRACWAGSHDTERRWCFVRWVVTLGRWCFVRWVITLGPCET